MAMSHVEALDRRYELVATVVGARRERVASRQADRLQYLFAAAVAAGVIALVPTTLAVPSGKNFPLLVALVLTIVIWLVLVGIGEFLRRRSGLG